MVDEVTRAIWEFKEVVRKLDGMIKQLDCNNTLDPEECEKHKHWALIRLNNTYTHFLLAILSTRQARKVNK